MTYVYNTTKFTLIMRVLLEFVVAVFVLSVSDWQWNDVILSLSWNHVPFIITIIIVKTPLNRHLSALISGVVTSGYRVRDGEWTEIGRMSPQLPQVNQRST